MPPLRVAIYTVGLNVFGFFAVAALTGYLAEGLRRADAQLQQASSELADVQAFSRHVVDSPHQRPRHDGHDGQRW